MNIIKDHVREEIVVLKSIFICDLFYVENEDQVKEYLKKIKKEFYDARHHVYAYIIGKKQENKKCSDDGEPAKTAGAPVLNILEKKELTNVLAIVTRYFGGTLLGTGGLVRAYSGACQKACENAITEPIIEKSKLTVLCSYKDYQSILQLGYDITTSAFSTDVYLEIEVPSVDIEKAAATITKVTNANAKLHY